MFDWLASWAALAPDRVAIEEPASGRELTYGALNERAARLAVGLREALSVEPGDRVALLAQSRAEVFELFFACSKLSAVFVPLSSRLAIGELRGIVSDCEPAALVYDGAFAETAVSLLDGVRGGRAVALEPGPGPDHRPYADLIRDARPTRLGPVKLETVAGLLYTSGTTGQPKGVQITNRQVLFNAINTALACELTSKDTCLAFLPLFHTGGLHCLATPLLHRGGRVVLLPRFDAEASVGLLASGRVSTTIAVPTMYKMLLDAGLLGRDPTTLRALLCGGAPLPIDLLEAYHDAGLPLRQGYGLTEVGPNCFTLGPLEGPHRLGSVGLPAFHSEARLVDAAGAEVAADTPGELWLRGPHVTTGYWRQPEATRRVLDERGWFHTGDLLKRSADGYFSVVGRLKDMFISGGENVYPAEVEDVLSAHPWVHQVAVVGVPDERWGQVGLAAIVPSPEAPEPFDTESLRRWTRQRLATYKVPRRWHTLAELPLNASGKVLKERLIALLLNRF